MKTQRTLDLHGVKHEDVTHRLEQFFFWDSSGFKNTKIITGKSTVMQDIVTEWLDGYDFKYYIPSNNLGEIQVIE
jgi:DNA-nicking Smr family endonuclease